MKTHRVAITEFTVFRGKNVHSHKPVIALAVDIGSYGEHPTKEIPGFNERLLSLFPTLKTNCCSLGYKGGFAQRLREGTYLAHVLEHIILEMQFLLGDEVSFGRTRAIKEPSHYRLIFEYKNELAATACAKSAVALVNRLIAGEALEGDLIMAPLHKIAVASALGPSTAAIVTEAQRRGIPVTRIGQESLVRLGYGRHARLIDATLTDATSCVGADIASNKQLTKALLEEQRIPVPEGLVVYSADAAVSAAQALGAQVAVKPLDGNQGKAVYLGLSQPEEICAAYKSAAAYSKGVLVEQFVQGGDFRVLVVGGRVSAVAKRLPPSVIGDGVHTVQELVALMNEDTRRGDGHERPLTKIQLDQVSRALLLKNSLTAESVVPPGQEVKLRMNGNLSTGGTAVDCTACIHPETAELAVRAAAVLGIDIAGVDIVTEAIDKPLGETGGVIVEVNAAPGIRMHLYPTQGQPRNVAREIVSYLFPNPVSTAFPIVSVTGTNGKTTVARLLQHCLMLTGKSVGLTSTQGTYINKRCIALGDNAGPRSARSLLSNKGIDAAVLETARGGLVREGLGYEAADVGVITNISEDHLGQDGLSTLDDLVLVKALVAEAVKNTGAAVLNGLDPTTPAVLRRLKTRVLLFYNGPRRELPDDYPDVVHVYNDEGWLRLRDGMKTINIAHVRDIPITLGGLVKCNIDNVLCAAAALYALNIPVEVIKAGLTGFADNDGRFELYDFKEVTVMLDYGHNAAGVKTAAAVCQALVHRRLIGVVGMPGDRRDEDILRVGEICGGAFDRLFVKEDEDKRGRRSGAVAGLLRDGALRAGFPASGLTVILDDRQALAQALEEAQPGDVIAVFYEKLEPLRHFLEQAGAMRQHFPGARILATV